MAKPTKPTPRRRPATPRPAAAAAAQQPGSTLYITLDQAAQMTGVSRSFLEREIAAGRLPAIRDVSLKIHRADLEAWRGQPVTVTAAAPPKKSVRGAGAAATAA